MLPLRPLPRMALLLHVLAFSGLRFCPVVMSSVSSFISSQLRSKNAADPKRTPLLSAILQEYALRRVFYQKNEPFPVARSWRRRARNSQGSISKKPPYQRQ